MFFANWLFWRGNLFGPERRDGPELSAKNLFDEPQIKFERIQGQRSIHLPKWKIIRIKCYGQLFIYTVPVCVCVYFGHFSRLNILLSNWNDVTSNIHVQMARSIFAKMATSEWHCTFDEMNFLDHYVHTAAPYIITTRFVLICKFACVHKRHAFNVWVVRKLPLSCCRHFFFSPCLLFRHFARSATHSWDWGIDIITLL